MRAAPSFFSYGPLGAANGSLVGFSLEERQLGSGGIVRRDHDALGSEGLGAPPNSEPGPFRRCR